MTQPAQNRSLTAADKAAAANLKAAWNARKRELGLTQESAAFALDMTQSGVSQYLAGRIALGLDATLRFARLLGVDPHTIRPDLDLPEQGAPAAAVSVHVEGQAAALHLRADELRDHGLLPHFASAYIAKASNQAAGITAGDEVLLDTRPASVTDGAIYSIIIDGQKSERTLFRRGAGRILVQSQHPQHPPFEVADSELTIIGRVVFRRGWI